MSRIELINDYYIEVDPLNYTLKQRFEGKDKAGNPKTSERIIGYYGTVEHAVEEMIKNHCQNVTKDFDGDLKHYAEIVDSVGKRAIIELRDVLEDM